MRPRAMRWLERSDEDLRGAEVALRGALYPLCTFLCQQAVEKLLKAIWVDRREIEPPRSHNLVSLAEELGLGLDEWEEFLRGLSSEAVLSRYPYGAPYEVDETSERFEWTLELCQVLRQQLS